MIQCQLHCLDGFRFLLKPEAQQTDDFQCVSYPSRVDIVACPQSSHEVLEMCRGSNVKDKLVTAFQLESLILAQNERWRQA